MSFLTLNRDCLGLILGHLTWIEFTQLAQVNRWLCRLINGFPAYQEIKPYRRWSPMSRRRQFWQLCGRNCLALIKNYDQLTPEDYITGFGFACREAQFDTAVWLWQSFYRVTGGFFTLTEDQFDSLFRQVAEQGHLMFLQWLLELDGGKFRSRFRGSIDSYDRFEDESRIFAYSLACGYFAQAQWLWQLGLQYHQPFHLHADQEAAFRWSCRNGFLAQAQWLWQLSLSLGRPIDLHILDETAFVEACSQGHLAIAQWLVQLAPIHLYAQDARAFINACDGHHQAVARWLYRRANRTSQPFRLENWLFIRLCHGVTDSNLAMVKWAWSLTPKGTKQQRYNLLQQALHHSCEYASLRVAQWLDDLSFFTLGRRLVLPRPDTLKMCLFPPSAYQPVLDWLAERK